MSNDPTTWSGWFVSGNVQMNVRRESRVAGCWCHRLIAPATDPNPDKNHIHVRYRIGRDLKYTDMELVDVVLCSVKEDGTHAIARHEFVKKINAAIGLKLDAFK